MTPAEIFVRAILSDSLCHPVYISGGHLATVGEMAGIVREFIPHAEITFGDRPVPHVYLVDNSRMLADMNYELPPLRDRIRDHINVSPQRTWHRDDYQLNSLVIAPC